MFVLPALLLLSPPLCWHSVPPNRGGLPRKFRRSSHRCHRPQAPAPLTRTTCRSQYLQCLTQSRERLFPALPALSSPLALLPALLRLLVRSSPSAFEGPLTRATHRHQLLLCSGRTAQGSACSAVRQAHAPTPILQFNRLSSPCAIAKINFSLFC